MVSYYILAIDMESEFPPVSYLDPSIEEVVRPTRRDTVLLCNIILLELITLTLLVHLCYNARLCYSSQLNSNPDTGDVAFNNAVLLQLTKIALQSHHQNREYFCSLTDLFTITA